MKTDFKRTLEGYQAHHGEFRLLDIPAMRYLMVDGHGDPNTSTEYAEALAALYPLAYAVKFASKTELGRDYVVPPLEALWWADDLAVFTTGRDKSRWDWTAMLMLPDWIGADLIDQARASRESKRPPVALERVRLESLAEGACVQTLHMGPYDEEAAVLAHMHEHVIPEHGLRMTGTHHEIYLSDPRRIPPARLRTILRQPVRPA